MRCKRQLPLIIDKAFGAAGPLWSNFIEWLMAIAASCPKPGDGGGEDTSSDESSTSCDKRGSDFCDSGFTVEEDNDCDDSEENPASSGVGDSITIDMKIHEVLDVRMSEALAGAQHSTVPLFCRDITPCQPHPLPTRQP